MPRALPTGTVTFLFTDIEGSTQLLHELGPEEYGRALAAHRRQLRDAFAAHGGCEVDTQGDALFVAFGTASGAAQAALGAQAALAGGQIAVRMGLHTGTPIATEEGYVGTDVHRGARIAALAHGGQIVVSPTTAALLDGMPLRDVGLHRLKDFDGATRLLQLGDGSFPPLRTPGSVALPTPATRFVGRERELFDAVSLVYERDPRVLTLHGPGGAGKTRFAIELARLLADEAEGGTVFVPLAPLREADLVVAAVAEQLGAASADVGSIAARVAGRRTHVVCDNVEHLLPLAAGRFAELVAGAPSLRLLVTSREVLRMQGESAFDLPPLADDEATVLFCERAQAVGVEVQPTGAVHELCRRLDGLPLAVELAAARTRLLAPEVLLERLGDWLDLLRGTRDADRRHATLRATIAWSFDLLDQSERRLFARLAVFRAGCTLESAEDVCAADVQTLGSLLDKSLVRQRRGRLGEQRFWLLETVRRFAVEQLDESADAAETRRRHAERMLAIAGAAHLTEEDDEPFQPRVVLAELADLRAALDWATEHDIELALELLVALENYWNTHAPEEALRRLDQLLPRADGVAPLLRARALRVRGGALHVSGDFDRCDVPYGESLMLYRELGDERGAAQLLERLANSASRRGDLEQAVALADESLRLSRGRFPFVEVANHTLLGRVRLLTGDAEGGRSLLRRSAAMAADLSWSWWHASCLTILAYLALDLGEVDEAERSAREALALARQDENTQGMLQPLTVLARVALARGEAHRAGVLWGAVETESGRAPSRAWERIRTERAGPLLTEADAAFLDAVDNGRRLELWLAAAIALWRAGAAVAAAAAVKDPSIEGRTRPFGPQALGPGCR